MFPKKNIDMYLEFTPVDFAANAIVIIMQFFNTKHNMFHLYNNNHIEMQNFINILEKMGILIDIVDDKICNLKVTGGCHGNLQGVSALIEGMNVINAVNCVHYDQKDIIAKEKFYNVAKNENIPCERLSIFWKICYTIRVKTQKKGDRYANKRKKAARRRDGQRT